MRATLEKLNCGNLFCLALPGPPEIGNCERLGKSRILLDPAPGALLLLPLGAPGSRARLKAVKLGLLLQRTYLKGLESLVHPGARVCP